MRHAIFRSGLKDSAGKEKENSQLVPHRQRQSSSAGTALSRIFIFASASGEKCWD
jgi:hypothetical protein